MIKPGTQVKKKSGKPFKSQLLTNTVKSVVDHPYVVGEKSYTFLEDDSVVSVCMVAPLIKEKEMIEVNKLGESLGNKIFALETNLESVKSLINKPTCDKANLLELLNRCQVHIESMKDIKSQLATME